MSKKISVQNASCQQLLKTDLSTLKSQFKDRKNKSPLELAGCKLPKIHNWIKYLHENYPKLPT